jgi:hypothetical protein
MRPALSPALVGGGCPLSTFGLAAAARRPPVDGEPDEEALAVVRELRPQLATYHLGSSGRP